MKPQPQTVTRLSPEARIGEINQFLGFAIGTWPGERALHQTQLSPRCATCIVNDRFSPLVGGRCRDCRERDQQVDAGGAVAPVDDAAGMDAVLAAHQGAGREAYDALVLFSGGKDSTYLLHRLRTRHPGLRLLAVMIDNGFASSVALANVDRVAALLDVDLQIQLPAAGLYRKAFRHALTHLQPGGCYTTVDRIDGDLTFDIGRNLAAALRIPLLIAGLSREQTTGILGIPGAESPRERETATRADSAGFALTEVFSAEERARYWWDGARQGERAPRVLFPLVAWGLGEQAIREEIIRLGLVAEGQDNPLATNSDLVPVMLALDLEVLGYSGFEPEFARMVRDGKADRETWLNIFQALEHQARRGLFLPRCIDETLARLGLTRAQLRLPAAG